MEQELRRILYDYLTDAANLDDVTDWMAKNFWNAPDVEFSLVDQVAHELAFLDDGLISEIDFQQRVHALLSNMVLEVDISLAGADPTVRTDPPEKVRIMEG